MLKHNVGDLVLLRNEDYSKRFTFDDKWLGIIVSVETDLYTRYKVKWVNRLGFNHFQDDEIKTLKYNLEMAMGRQ